MYDSMSSDLAEIRQDALAAHSCLVTSDPTVSTKLHDLEKKVTELSQLLIETQNQLSLKSKGENLADELTYTKSPPAHFHRNMLCIPYPLFV